MPEDYTDATLIEDLLAIRGTINADGIAKDIVHLESSGLIERDAWGHISITTKGRLLYGIVREMKIADICEVIKMDNLMKEVTRDKISASAYDTQIKQITRDVTAEILASAKLYPRMEEDIPCPHCSEGRDEDLRQSGDVRQSRVRSLCIPPVLWRDTLSQRTRIAHQYRLHSSHSRIPRTQRQDLQSPSDHQCRRQYAGGQQNKSENA